MASIGSSFGSMVRNNKKEAYKTKLQQTVQNISTRQTGGGSASAKVSTFSTGRTGGGSNLNVGNNENSVFNNSNAQTVNGKKAYSTQDFAQIWTNSSTEEVDETKQKTIQAQNELLSALADEDGDGYITEAEAKKLDVVGEDGVITDEDIQAIYESLDLLSDDASLGDLLDAISGILGDSAAAAEIADEIKGISVEHTGVKQNDDGTFSVTVEPFRGGKVQKDGDVMRYPNGSFWGMVTNAYPDLKESEKEQVYNEISKMNGFDWKTHVLHPGDEVKMPVVTRTEDGKLQFSEKVPQTKKTEDTKKTDDEKKTDKTTNEHALGHGFPESGTMKIPQGQITKDDDGYSLTLNNGTKVPCEYDEETGNVKLAGAERADKPGQYGYDYTITTEDGKTININPHMGKYNINGEVVEGLKVDNDGNVTFPTPSYLNTQQGVITCQGGQYSLNGMPCEYNEETGEITIAVEPSDKPSQYGYSYTLPDGQEITPYMGKYSMSGQSINIKYNPENETVTFVTTPGEPLMSEDELKAKRDAQTEAKKETPEPEGEQEENPTPEAAKDKSTVPTLTDAQADEKATALYNAMKGAGTDEEAVKNILINEGYGSADIVKIMDTFDSKYDESLMSWIQNDFSGAEETQLREALYGAAKEQAQLKLGWESKDDIPSDIATLANNFYTKFQELNAASYMVDFDKMEPEMKAQIMIACDMLHPEQTSMSRITEDRVYFGSEDQYVRDIISALKGVALTPDTTVAEEEAPADNNTKKADEFGENYNGLKKQLENAPIDDRMSYLNTILDGDYDLTPAEKGALVAEAMDSANDVSREDKEELATKIPGIVINMDDQELLDFAKAFKDNNLDLNYESLAQFMEGYAGNDNSAEKTAFATRVANLYGNSADNMAEVLQVFDSVESIQDILRSDNEISVLTQAVGNLNQNIDYKGNNVAIDNAVNKVLNGDMSLKDVLDGGNYTSAEKGFILSELGSENVVNKLWKMSDANEEKYFKEILLDMSEAVKTTKSGNQWEGGYKEVFDQMVSQNSIGMTSYLNTVLDGDYGLSAAEKGDLIKYAADHLAAKMPISSASGFVNSSNELQLKAQCQELAEKIPEVMKDMTDAELLEFGQGFSAEQFGKDNISLPDFIEKYAGGSTDNTAAKIAFANRITTLYKNNPDKIDTVLQTFPSQDSVQYLLSNSTETEVVKDLVNDLCENVEYDGKDIAVENAISKINSGKMDLKDILTGSYTDQEKGYILSKIGSDKVTNALRNMGRDNQEKYFEQIIRNLSSAAV